MVTTTPSPTDDRICGLVTEACGLLAQPPGDAAVTRAELLRSELLAAVGQAEDPAVADDASAVAAELALVLAGARVRRPAA